MPDDLTEAMRSALERVPYIDYLPDDSEEAFAIAPVLSRPCVGCPYTPGTAASKDRVTSRLAAESAKARCAFWCHMTVSPTDDFPTHLCAGWAILAKGLGK